MKVDPANLDFRESHHLSAGAISPRPVVLISTIGENGVLNVAPFGTLTRVSMKPLLMGFNVSTRRDGQKKDTIRNVEYSKEFVVSIVNEALSEPMNQAGADYPSDVDEFKEVGLTPVKADIVKAPLVGESPINFECRLVQILEFGQSPQISQFIIGEVVMIHVKDEFYVAGSVQPTKLKAIGRLGADLYCRTTDIFEMKRAFIP